MTRKGLDEAQAKGWTVVDLKQDWKASYPEAISRGAGDK